MDRTNETASRQRIVDALKALSAEYGEAHRAAMALVQERRDALQAECGSIGHVWTVPGMPDSFFMPPGLHCAICRKRKSNED